MKSVLVLSSSLLQQDIEAQVMPVIHMSYKRAERKLYCCHTIIRIWGAPSQSQHHPHVLVSQLVDLACVTGG